MNKRKTNINPPLLLLAGGGGPPVAAATFDPGTVCSWCKEPLRTGFDDDPTRLLPEVALINGTLEGHLDCVYSQLAEALPGSAMAEGTAALIQRKLKRQPRYIPRHQDSERQTAPAAQRSQSMASLQVFSVHELLDEEEIEELAAETIGVPMELLVTTTNSHAQSTLTEQQIPV